MRYFISCGAARLTALCILCLLMTATSWSAEPVNMSLEGKRGTIGTASVGGSFYMWAAGWSKLLESHTGYALAVESTSGVFHNIRLLEVDELDFAMAFFPALHDVGDGTRGPKGTKLNKARIMFAYAPYYMIILTPQSKNISMLRDLQGMRVNLLPKGGGSDTYNRALFDILGIKPARIVNSSAADAIASLNDGMVDAVAGIGAHPWGPAMEAEVNQPMHIVGYSDKDIEKVLPHLPGWFRVARPDGGYKSERGSPDTLAYLNAMVASVYVPESTIYIMTKLFFQNKEHFRVIDRHTLAARMEDVLQSPIKLHPGAARYYKEQGLDIPAHLLD